MPRNPQTSGSKQKILSEHIIKKVSLEEKEKKQKDFAMNNRSAGGSFH